MSEEEKNNSTPNIKQMSHEELVEYYKNRFREKPILAAALIKLANAKAQIGQISYSETGHKRISPLQILKDYPDVVKAVALSKVALKRASETSDINEHKRFAQLATDSIYLAMQNKMLPAYMSNYLQALQINRLFARGNSLAMSNGGCSMTTDKSKNFFRVSAEDDQ